MDAWACPDLELLSRKQVIDLTIQSSYTHAGRRLRIPIRLLIALAAALILGAGVAALSPGDFLPGWLASGLLLFPAFYFLLLAWEWGGADRTLAWMVALAFALRLGLGILLSLALPAWGYPDQPVQQAGYLFRDAYARDTQAWQLAESPESLLLAFSADLPTDQYGGMLASSAAVYRYLSPDQHRPFLPLIMGAFFAALGVPFLRQAVRLRWSGRVAAITTWVYVLYPDALFFGSSQLREPFLMGLLAVAFWALLALDRFSPGVPRDRKAWLALFVSLVGMALFSTQVAAAAAGFLGLLFLIEYVVSRKEPVWILAGILGLAVSTLVLLVFSWDWFRSSAAFDLLVTTRLSGSIAVRVEEVSQALHLPPNAAGALVNVLYGVTRPVLPAAIADSDSNLFARVTGIVRSAGWYALAPFLVYALFTVWKEPDAGKRRRVIWLALTMVLWVLISSARGGGDATDNPRYRSLFLPWLALLAAWAVEWSLTRRDAWLWRWLAVEAIFLSFFSHWYLSRYYRLWARLEFWQVVACIVGFSALVLVGGWLLDRRKRLRAAAAESEGTRHLT
jgi:hypothetical protein